MPQMIQLRAEDVLGGIDVKTLAEALLARVSENCHATLESRVIPMIGQPWPGQGGINAGLVRGRDSGPDYYLIVATEDLAGSNWADAGEWAKGLKPDGHRDFTLPWRNEQAVLFGNVPELFQKEYYWSREQHAEDDDFAWVQHFSSGYQDDYRKHYQFRARAVRRSVI